MKKKKLDGLLQTLETIISANRCSLSDEDKVLLQRCMDEIRQTEDNPLRVRKTVEEVVKWLLLFLEVGSKFIEMS